MHKWRQTSNTDYWFTIYLDLLLFFLTSFLIRVIYTGGILSYFRELHYVNSLLPLSLAQIRNLCSKWLNLCGVSLLFLLEEKKALLSQVIKLIIMEISVYVIMVRSSWKSYLFDNKTAESQAPLASYADALWDRHVYLPRVRGGGMRNEPKENLCRRLRLPHLNKS